MKQRIHYNFTGCVQGVGFRFTASHAAAALGLTGWVRNEYDGSVTMEVQGEEEALAAVVELIERSPSIYIDQVRSEDMPLDMEEKAFKIRF
ncbi:MAG: acylphosphatase [Treponema sp.]|nr:acylphosphatase [Treponema sp.]